MTDDYEDGYRDGKREIADELLIENNSLREQLSNMQAVVASVEKERDAHIEAHEHMYELMCKRTDELAATEALVAQYRTALEKIGGTGPGEGSHQYMALSALALPSPTAALNNAIAENWNDCIENVLWLYSPDDTATDWAEKIRGLSR